MKTIFLFLLLVSTLFGRYEAKPLQACEAYNNMKHSKNTNDVRLELSRSYPILREHKGQKLIISGDNPSQRWVDGACFPNKSLKNKSFKEAPLVKTSSSNLLALSWQNAFCQTHQYKKECKRDSKSLVKNRGYDSKFVLHGLWPQPRNNIYCHTDKALVQIDKNKQWRDLPCLALDIDLEKALEKVMAGFASDLHKHEWIKHGTCYGTDANSYYRDAISLTNQVNSSHIAKFFRDNVGKSVTLKEVRNLANKSFGRGAGDRIEMRCKAGLVTELWLHLGAGEKDLAKLLQKGKKVRSRCQDGRIDKAGFGR